MINLDKLSPTHSRLHQLEQRRRYLGSRYYEILKLVYGSEEPVPRRHLCAELGDSMTVTDLAVYLHRMVKKGDLIQPARGWYAHPDHTE